MAAINGQKVGSIGYGLMGLTWRSSPPPQEQAFAAMRTALQSGANFWNGGEFYGTPEYNSMVLLNQYFEKYPEDANKVVLSIKGATNLKTYSTDGSPEGIRNSMDNVLKQLGGSKKLDIFECSRRDPTVPLEITFGVLQREYIETGKLGGISLSEVSAATIHEAVRVAKIVAVEVELSLWATEVLENGVAAACAQYGIPLIAYSPIGRGMLTGEIKSPDDIPEGDMRKRFPRFQPGNFEVNIKLVEHVVKMAATKGCTPAQLAINWVRCQSKKSGMPVIIPIPGATTHQRVNENSIFIELTGREMEEIEETLATLEVKGRRYPEGFPIET